MFKLSIQSSTKTYPITIGLGSIERLRERDLVVIADRNLDHVTAVFGDRVIKLDASEENKTLRTCEKVIEELKALGCNRDTVVAAIGGGFVQDIATLTCSLYMRGIPWIYVPTTLMAMMDSCIGGKSSINVGAAKNLIGNFCPPNEIIIDPQLLSSLDGMAIASGLAEGVKICYAKGPTAFEKFCDSRAAIGTYNSDLGAELIAHVLNAKKWFVETDEFDQGPRKLLNFGHTFGHALESATSFQIPHGVAIGIGVLAALQHPLSHDGQLEKRLSQECLSILSPVSKELRAPISALNEGSFEVAFRGDKKHSREHFRLVLSQQGTLRVVDVERNDQELAVVKKAITSALAMVANL